MLAACEQKRRASQGGGATASGGGLGVGLRQNSTAPGGPDDWWFYQRLRPWVRVFPHHDSAKPGGSGNSAALSINFRRDCWGSHAMADEAFSYAAKAAEKAPDA